MIPNEATSIQDGLQDETYFDLASQKETYIIFQIHPKEQNVQRSDL